MFNISNKYLKHSINIVCILLGTFVMGAGFNIFYAPKDILLGGFGGLSTIISYLLSLAGINISMSIIYLLLNVVLYIFAVKILGKTFAIYAIIGIVFYSVFLEFCTFPAVSDDILLCSIYGGFLTGLGIGVIIRCGATTGGGDMLGCIINHKIPKISVGWVTIIVNCVVLLISFFIYGLNLSLYSIIGIFISGKTSDLIIEGPRSVKAFYIISPKFEDISNKLLTELHRGVTTFEANGMYSHKHMEVILCLVSQFQISKLKQIVYDIDPSAFLFSVSVKEAMGKGFHKLEKHKSILNRQKQKQNLATNISEQSYKTVPPQNEIKNADISVDKKIDGEE